MDSLVGDRDSIIFDLDGTLWDCTAITAKSITMLFERIGSSKKVSTECIRRIAGRPVAECEELLLEGVEPEHRARARAELVDFAPFSLEERGDLALYDGVAEGLARLEERYKLFLVSNCGIPYLDSFMRFSGVGHFFKDVECFGRTLRPKDENISSVVRRQKLISPCYVGDTESDQAAALSAGVPFLHIAHGFGGFTGDAVSFATFAELTWFFLK